MKALMIKMIGLYLNVLAYLSPATAGRKGFMLFCRPFRLTITQKQREFFNSADKFMLEIEGHSVQGYQWGRGPRKILFLHGWQSHTYRWKAYIEALSKDEYTIYALDAPGHGLSGGDFLSVPLYSTLIENFIREKDGVHSVVAHSLGGFSLLYTFHRFPLLPINNIILMAPPGEASDFITVFKDTLGISERALQLVIDYFAAQYDVTPEYFSTTKFASSVNVRGLIIHDEDDAEAPYRYSIPLQQTWEKSRLVTTKGFGHNLRSATVVKEVVEFIRESVPQPALS
jgi:pimeloyl-ACP methyl ester carboxylesterase